MKTREAAWGTMLGQTRNILVQSDNHTDQSSICNKLFEGAVSPRAVVVSFEQSVEDWISDYQQSSFESVAFMSVGETVRSTATTTPTITTNPTGTLAGLLIDGVGDPADLPALGLRIRSHLEAFHESDRGEVVVCFNSLSALLDEVSLRQAFRFLHILTNLISAYDATAHYHYDDNLTAQDLDTLRPLFDAEFSSHTSHDIGAWTLVSNPRPSKVE